MAIDMDLVRDFDGSFGDGEAQFGIGLTPTNELTPGSKGSLGGASFFSEDSAGAPLVQEVRDLKIDEKYHLPKGSPRALSAAAVEAAAGLDLDSSESATMLAELLRE